MYQEQMAPALRAYLTSLREKAYVDIAPGFVDTGASAKQTKPVYAASTPPAVKKKTKKARLDSDRTVTPAAPSSTPALAAAPAAKTTASAKKVSVSTGKKSKKVHREKIRYGQAPRTRSPLRPKKLSLPAPIRVPVQPPASCQHQGQPSPPSISPLPPPMSTHSLPGLPTRERPATVIARP